MSKKNTEEKQEKTQETVPVDIVDIEEFIITMNGEPIEMRRAFVTYLKTLKEPLKDEIKKFEKKYNDFKIREVN